MKQDIILFEGSIPLINSITEFGWKYDLKEYYLETSNYLLDDIGYLELLWIKCKSGDKYIHRKILSAEFTSQPFLILKLFTLNNK